MDLEHPIMTMMDDGRPLGAKWHTGLGGFLLRESPYLLMLVLALFGVAYTSISQTGVYWVILAPLIGLVCIVSRWPEARAADQHVYLVVSQVLHWGAVLAAMQLMSLAVTRQVSGVASALGVLTLLALGTFTAGLHIRAWKVAIVGLILGASVPGIALLEQSALFIVLIVGLIVAAAAPFLWQRSRKPSRPSHPLHQAPAAPVRSDPVYQPPVASPPLPQAPVPERPLYETTAPSRPVAQPPLYEPPAPATAQAPVAPIESERLSPSISVPGDDEPAVDAEPGRPSRADNVRDLLGARTARRE
jgi:hypothetical protein